MEFDGEAVAKVNTSRRRFTRSSPVVAHPARFRASVELPRRLKTQRLPMESHDPRTHATKRAQLKLITTNGC